LALALIVGSGTPSAYLDSMTPRAHTALRIAAIAWIAVVALMPRSGVGAPASKDAVKAEPAALVQAVHASSRVAPVTPVADSAVLARR